MDGRRWDLLTKAATALLALVKPGGAAAQHRSALFCIRAEWDGAPPHEAFVYLACTRSRSPPMAVWAMCEVVAAASGGMDIRLSECGEGRQRRVRFSSTIALLKPMFALHAELPTIYIDALRATPLLESWPRATATPSSASTFGDHRRSQPSRPP